MYDLYLIFNVFHSKGVALWAGDVYDYVILFYLDGDQCPLHNICIRNTVNPLPTRK